MGNENTKHDQEKHEPINKAVEALEKEKQKYQMKNKQLMKKQLVQQQSKEALEMEKQMYEKKYKELMEKELVQQQSSNDINRNIGPFVNIQESLQTTSAIYPNLQNINYTAPPNMMHSPYMSGATPTNFEPRYSAPVPTAPPPPPPVVPAFNTNNAIASISRPDHEGNNNRLDCKSCNGKLGNQVFQCQNKHNSCKNCRMRQVSCGVCGQNIIDFRNFALEKRLACLNTNNQMEKCPNSVDGCCLRFKPLDIPLHMKECPFNDIVCPLVYISNGCSWRGKVSQLKSHFNQQHPEHCEGDLDKEMTLPNYKAGSHAVHFIALGPFNFLIHIKVDERDNVIMMTAQFFGTKMSATKWSYQFHVFNKRTPKRKFQFNAVCHSYNTPVQSIFADMNCAVMGAAYADSFANNGRLTYKFYLIKDLSKCREKVVPTRSS